MATCSTGSARCRFRIAPGGATAPAMAAGPDRGDKGWSPEPRDSYWPPHADGMDPEEVVRFKSHDFR